MGIEAHLHRMTTPERNYAAIATARRVAAQARDAMRTSTAYGAHATDEPRASPDAAPNVRIASGYGRLYVVGPDCHAVAGTLSGAVYNPRRHGYECSLTLTTLRTLRTRMRLSARTFARMCEPDVVRWARAAEASEQQVADLHARLADGWLVDLPWRDFTWREHGEPAPRVPYEHQKIMATAAVTLDGVAFVCDVGTGKTRAAIEAMAAHVRNGTLGVVVVVCPKKVIRTWERELDSWARGTLRAVPVAAGRARNAQLAALRPGDVLIVNYDVLHTVVAALDTILPGRPLGLVLDEVHRCKNPNARRTKAAMKLAQHAIWRVVQTGSPILQGVQDIWSQWYCVDYGVAFGANYVTFKHEYTTTNPWTHEITPREGALEQAGTLMRRRGLRYRKEDCLDLPPRVYEVEDVDMTPEQARAYAAMRDVLVARLRDEDGSHTASAANQLSAIMRLAQITSGFLPDENGVIHRFQPNPKLNELETMVDEFLAAGQQVIVWAWYREDVRAICERLARHAPVTIVGGQHADASTHAEESFQAGTSRLLVANPGAGGVGLNLQAASVAIYYSQSYALEHRLQSEGRNHRAGSERHAAITYIDLVCRDTIDEVVRGALTRKADTAAVVVDLRRHLGLNSPEEATT